MKPLGRLAALAAVGVGLGCRASAPGPWHEEPGYRWRDAADPGRRTAGFTSMKGGTTGITFRNDVSADKAFANRHLVQGSGVAMGDIDGDGLPDIYLTRTDGPNVLYHNLGGFRFENIAREAGVELGDRPSTGAVFADVDGDGDLDLIVASMGGRNSLFLNDGHGRFTDATAQSGFVPESRGSTSIAVADVDGDGDLDVYITNYKAKTMLDSLPPQERAFDQLVKKIGDQYEVVPALRDNYKVVLRKEINAVAVVQRAEPDWFYLNDGKGHFTRESLAHNPRFLDEAGHQLAREPDDFGLAAKFVDLNGDGAPDLYVANDFEDPDQFWINDGTGHFRLIARDAIRQTSNSGMALDAADIDRDGKVDLFEVDMMANDSHRAKTQIPTHTPLPKVVGDYQERSQWQRNVLFRNRGDGTFAEVGMMDGVEASGWSWSALFLDVDLDGYEDLLIGNGHVWDLMDGDVLERLKSSVTGTDWRAERKFYPRLALRNVAFHNQAGHGFDDRSTAWRFGIEEDISHGMAVADLDGDGDLDVVINRLDAPALVLRNDAPAPRVEVRLAGTAPNTAGAGAVITVTAAKGPVQSREVTLGGLYLSGSDPALTFAALSDTLVIDVRWRSGRVSRITGARPNRIYEIREPAGAAPQAPSAHPPIRPLFSDRSSLIDYVHQDRPFGETDRQPLLPFEVGRLGPGIGWVDLNGDGVDDLIIGSGAGGRLGVFLSDHGRFRRIESLRADSLDLTSVANGGGGTAVVGQSSYEASSPAAALAAAAVFRIGRTGAAESIVGGDTTSAGPIALADIDGDGDLDVFVGGRVAPGVYPLPANSRLFRNEGGRLVLDEANGAVLRGIGLVSAAVFTDIDQDGDPDLVVATDWGGIKLLINDHGRFTDQTHAWHLDDYLGRWNGITTGDFDGDGRIDLVATNWGTNTGATADPTRPLYLYYGAWGGTGVSMAMAQYDPRIQGIAPLVTLSRLGRALPGQRQRTPTFAAYADATIEQALGDGLKRGGRWVVTTLEHTVFLNRGDHFEAHPLPRVAQEAPAFGVVVADFDGDGADDLFLAQNFSATSIATPRFDAGRGLVLLGDGRGGFRPLDGAESGIALPADQRGAAAADFDGDGRIDLAVGQNAAPVRLFRNETGAPGIRVRLVGAESAGATVRLEYANGSGPIHEVHYGSGYWSQDGSVVVLGRRPGSEVRAVVVKWPGGRVQRMPVDPTTREVVVKAP